MQRRPWYGRDFGLQLRMAFSMLLLVAVFMSFAYLLFRLTGLAIFLVVLPLTAVVLQYFFSYKAVLGAIGARQVDARQAPKLHGIVQRLAQQADLPMPRLAIADMAMPNAFVTGRGPKHAVVCVTTGLLHKLSSRELQAVLGHEMTHIKNRDMTVMTMATSFAAVITWIVLIIVSGMRPPDRLEADSDSGGDLGGCLGGCLFYLVFYLVIFLVVLLVGLAFVLISWLLVLALSRYREYAADRGGAILTGAPEQLQAALLKINDTMQHIPSEDLRKAQPLSALFIASPSKESFFELFSNHPSVEHRIARLEKLAQGMARH